jgi:hypothetical protein
MSVSDLKDEARGREIEPLLPIEKKLISWSFGLGIVLLVVLVALNHWVPVKF